jgi:hypothetical protein
MTGPPPNDPIEDPTAPDMAVSGVGHPTRDVPPSTLDWDKQTGFTPPSDLCVTDRQESALGIPSELPPAAERTPPMGLTETRKADLDTPYSENPSMEPPGRVTRGHPARLLTSVELRMCEIWTRATGIRAERAQFVVAELQRKYGEMATEDEIIETVLSRAGRKYRNNLLVRGRKLALRVLQKNTTEVVEDYLWSRTAAKAQLDYKEVRLAAVDHLDRLGVTLKREAPQQQAQIIVLKGSNFDVATLDAPTPEVLATEILQDDAL